MEFLVQTGEYSATGTRYPKTTGYDDIRFLSITVTLKGENTIYLQVFKSIFFAFKAACIRSIKFKTNW